MSTKMKPLYCDQFNVAVDLAEDCCRVRMKLRVSNEIVFCLKMLLLCSFIEHSSEVINQLEFIH